MMRTKLEITYGSYIRFFIVLIGLLFLYYMKDILVLLFLVIIIVAGLSPSVERWAKYITRPGAVFAMFVLIFGLLGLMFSLIIPPLVDQIKEFSNDLPNIVQRLSTPENQSFIDKITNSIADNLNTLSSKLTDVTGFVLTQTLGVLSGLIAAITVIVLSFYFLLEEEGLRKIFKGVIPEGSQVGISETVKKITVKLGAWLRGQLLLMLVVGVTTTIGLYIVGVPYPLTLGLWAGLTEIVPWLGPWLGAIPGVAVGFTQSPLTGILTLVVYLFVQQAESNLLVPRIMGKAVGLNPIVVLLAILVGEKLYGIFGILLSVPMAAVISVIVEDWDTVTGTFQSINKKAD